VPPWPMALPQILAMSCPSPELSDPSSFPK
jgi:hypothetical protein